MPEPNETSVQNPELYNRPRHPGGYSQPRYDHSHNQHHSQDHGASGNQNYHRGGRGNYRHSRPYNNRPYSQPQPHPSYRPDGFARPPRPAPAMATTFDPYQNTQHPAPRSYAPSAGYGQRHPRNPTPSDRFTQTSGRPFRPRPNNPSWSHQAPQGPSAEFPGFQRPPQVTAWGQPQPLVQMQASTGWFGVAGAATMETSASNPGLNSTTGFLQAPASMDEPMQLAEGTSPQAFHSASTSFIQDRFMSGPPRQPGPRPPRVQYRPAWQENSGGSNRFDRFQTLPETQMQTETQLQTSAQDPAMARDIFQMATQMQRQNGGFRDTGRPPRQVWKQPGFTAGMQTSSSQPSDHHTYSSFGTPGMQDASFVDASNRASPSGFFAASSSANPVSSFLPASFSSPTFSNACMMSAIVILLSH